MYLLDSLSKHQGGRSGCDYDGGILLGGSDKRGKGERMKNIDIRLIVSGKGIHYKDIAAFLGMCNTSLSRMMSKELNPRQRARILYAIACIEARKEQNVTDSALSVTNAESGDTINDKNSADGAGGYERRTGTNEKALLYMAREMDKKLKQLMTQKDYMAFSIRVARDAFRLDCKGMADSNFKAFCLEHLNEIVGEDAK